MMGFDPMSLKYIALADEAGLGNGCPENIEVVGEDVSRVNWGFTVGDNFASRFGDIFWFGPLRFLQKLLFQTPIVYIFVLGSFLYHDYVWYEIFGKRAVKKWSETGWGELFERY
jgi:hypothetical protein